MKFRSAVSVVLFVLFGLNEAFSQTISVVDNKGLIPVNVNTVVETYKGKESLKVTGTTNGEKEEFVKISNVVFKNGTIELELAGQPAADAPEGSRGFVGIAFRINDDNTKFECIYLRPTNGRADDQVRRNHSVQYVSMPDYPWQRLRKENTEKYESYVDLVAGEWTSMRIEVKGTQAKLFVHGSAQPSLIVNDLKLGADNQGSIGLWIGSGTEAHFAKVEVSNF